MGACVSCCERVLRVLRLPVRRRAASIRPESVSDSFRAEIETTPVLADEALPQGKFSDKPPEQIDPNHASSKMVPIYIDKNMSSPTIHIGREGMGEEEQGSGDGQDARKNNISGHGLALVDTSVGQDGAYWEWHIGNGDTGGTGGAGQDHENVMVGVSTKRTQDFYKILADSDGAASSLKLATKLMRTVRANHGDTIGVAVSLNAEKPFVQLLLNGELQEEFILGRFRGVVFPSIWLPKPDGTARATFVVDEASFRYKSPGANFLPMAVTSARGGTLA